MTNSIGCMPARERIICLLVYTVRKGIAPHYTQDIMYADHITCIAVRSATCGDLIARRTMQTCPWQLCILCHCMSYGVEQSAI